MERASGDEFDGKRGEQGSGDEGESGRRGNEKRSSASERQVDGQMENGATKYAGSKDPAMLVTVCK